MQSLGEVLAELHRGNAPVARVRALLASRRGILGPARVCRWVSSCALGLSLVSLLCGRARSTARFCPPGRKPGGEKPDISDNGPEVFSLQVRGSFADSAGCECVRGPQQGCHVLSCCFTCVHTHLRADTQQIYAYSRQEEKHMQVRDVRMKHRLYLNTSGTLSGVSASSPPSCQGERTAL